jgi:two-component system OmpR family response regulator
MTTPIRVIVVDDDASIRDAIADRLLLWRQVRVAADATALDVLLQVDRPDVIILDWMMPGEDGCRSAAGCRHGPSRS